MDLADSRPLAGAVVIEPTEDGAGRRAAAAAADLIVAAQQRQGSARVIFASAPSQEAMLAHLGTDDRIDWTAVRSFHMDDYLGLAPDHPQGFGQWLSDRLPEAGRAGLERIDTTADPDEEVARYTRAAGRGADRRDLSRHRGERPHRVQRAGRHRLRR